MVDHEKLRTRTLALAALILFLRVVVIEPAEYTAVGLKFTIDDPVVLRGAVALVFIHFVFLLFSRSEAPWMREIRAARLGRLRRSLALAKLGGLLDDPKRKKASALDLPPDRPFGWSL